MKTVQVATIFVALTVVMIVVVAVPVSAGEIKYIEIGKDYKVQGGHGNGFRLFEMYTQLNASDNLTFNWKSGIKGDGTNYWYLIIYTYRPVLNWSNEWPAVNNMECYVSMVSSQKSPPLSLYIKPSASGLVGINVWTYGAFVDQTWNVTVNRSSGQPDYEQRISDLEDQIQDLGDRLGALNDTVADLNDTIGTLLKDVANLSKRVDDLEARVEDLEGTLDNHTHNEFIELRQQIDLLNSLYLALQENMTTVQQFIGDLNFTDVDNVTVIYKNITNLYENITELTNMTVENVTKTIMMYQNTTKQVNAYDNKTLQALAKNITRASEEISGLAQDLNQTAGKAAGKEDVQDLEGTVNGLKNTTARKTELNTTNNSVAAATVAGLIVALAVTGALHSGNKRRIKEHDDSIALLMEATKPVPKTEIKKASAKKTEDLDEVLKKLKPKKPPAGKTADDEVDEDE